MSFVEQRVPQWKHFEEVKDVLFLGIGFLADWVFVDLELPALWCLDMLLPPFLFFLLSTSHRGSSTRLSCCCITAIVW
jgi:hypothetical protein